MASEMNKMIKVYSEIHSWVDYRRGALQVLLTEGKVYPTTEAWQEDANRLWDLYYAKRYEERRMDDFSLPELGITNEKFLQTVREADLSYFAMYHPTGLDKSITKLILDVEQLDNPSPSIKGVILYVNTFPYQLDVDLQAELVSTLTRSTGGRYDVRLIHVDPLSLTASHYGQYEYVFSYGIIKDNHEWFIKSLTEVPIPQTTFIVPALFSNVNNLVVGTPEDILYGLAATLSPVIRLIPCNHSVYDYRKVP